MYMLNPTIGAMYNILHIENYTVDGLAGYQFQVKNSERVKELLNKIVHDGRFRVDADDEIKYVKQ